MNVKASKGLAADGRCAGTKWPLKKLPHDFQTDGNGWLAIMIHQGSGHHLNATSTRIRRFGAVVDGESQSMPGFVGMEDARDQRLA